MGGRRHWRLETAGYLVRLLLSVVEDILINLLFQITNGVDPFQAHNSAIYANNHTEQ